MDKIWTFWIVCTRAGLQFLNILGMESFISCLTSVQCHWPHTWIGRIQGSISVWKTCVPKGTPSPNQLTKIRFAFTFLFLLKKLSILLSTRSIFGWLWAPTELLLGPSFMKLMWVWVRIELVLLLRDTESKDIISYCVQFCPFYPILSILSNFVQFVQFCPICPILSILSILTFD